MFQRSFSLRVVAVFFLVLTVLLPANGSAAINYPVDENEFTLDDAELLSVSQETILNDLSGAIYDDWGTEIVFVLINSTADYETENTTNTTLVDFTIGLFDEWNLFESEYDDAILMVLATNQSGNWSLAVETGTYWLDNGDFNDMGIEADPYFDSQDWFIGMRLLLTDLTEMVDWWLCDGACDDTSSDAGSLIPAPVSTDPSVTAEELTLQEGLMCMGCLVVLVLVAFFAFRSGFGRGGNGYGNGMGYYGGGGGWGRQSHSTNINETNIYTGGGGGVGNQPNQQQGPSAPQTVRPKKSGTGTRGLRRGRGGGGRGGGGGGSRSGFSRSGGGGGRSRGGGRRRR